MAALGWNLSLLAYTSGVGEAVIQTGGLADDISLAAASGARVINMSFHTTKVQSGKNCPRDYDEVHSAIQSAQLWYNVVFVAAAGNGSLNGCGDGGTVPFANYPAAYSEVIAVTSSKQDDSFPINFNYSDPSEDSVTVTAPGENILIPNFPGAKRVFGYDWSCNFSFNSIGISFSWFNNKYGSE